MNRRDFFKSSIGAILGLSLPLEISASLTIVDIKLLDSFKETMQFHGHQIVDGQAVVSVTIDTADLWRHVRLVDSEGREWQTGDEGKTWKSGLMAFSLGLYDETTVEHIKPLGCTCAYPQLIARNMNGHVPDCPIYIEWAKEVYGADL